MAHLDRGPADGAPVLLLHGFPDDATSYARVMEALAARGHRAIAPFIRGVGGIDSVTRRPRARGLVVDLTGEEAGEAELVRGLWHERDGAGAELLLRPAERALVRLDAEPGARTHGARLRGSPACCGRSGRPPGTRRNGGRRWNRSCRRWTRRGSRAIFRTCCAPPRWPASATSPSGRRHRWWSTRSRSDPRSRDDGPGHRFVFAINDAASRAARGPSIDQPGNHRSLAGIASHSFLEDWMSCAEQRAATYSCNLGSFVDSRRQA